MKLSDQLITRLKEELKIDIPLGTKISHLKPSLNQQARGSFLWVFDGGSGIASRYGSTMGVRELLKCNKLEINYSKLDGGLSTLAGSLYDILGYENLHCPRCKHKCSSNYEYMVHQTTNCQMK